MKLNLDKCKNLQRKQIRKMYIQSIKPKNNNKILSHHKFRKNPLLKALNQAGILTTRNRPYNSNRSSLKKILTPRNRGLKNPNKTKEMINFLRFIKAKYNIKEKK